MLEILTGIVGARRRWRTMPRLVLLFGLMIAPLGVVSITFIVIQPIVIGTWCSLCLIAAAAMLTKPPIRSTSSWRRFSSSDAARACCGAVRRRRR